MKNCGKFLIIVAAALAISAILTSCNQAIFDTKWHFNKAIIGLGDFERTVVIASWKDFDESDCVQFTDTDGNTYLTHYSNVILLDEVK